MSLSCTSRTASYLVAEPISARRLVHVLVKLGKIAKSTSHQPQQRPAASPSMLPEDREVTAIMTKRPVSALVLLSQSLNRVSSLCRSHRIH